MRHDGNGGRKSASDFSRFPVSASVPYTIYMSRMKLNALTKPARIATESVLSLSKEIGFVSHLTKKVGSF